MSAAEQLGTTATARQRLGAWLAAAPNRSWQREFIGPDRAVVRVTLTIDGLRMFSAIGSTEEAAIDAALRKDGA